MLTISNLAYLRTSYIPKLIKQFQDAFRVDMEVDTAVSFTGSHLRIWSMFQLIILKYDSLILLFMFKTLMDVIGQLDALLLGDYIKRKSVILSGIIETGVLGGQIDWHLASKPTGE